MKKIKLCEQEIHGRVSPAELSQHILSKAGITPLSITVKNPERTKVDGEFCVEIYVNDDVPEEWVKGAAGSYQASQTKEQAEAEREKEYKRTQSQEFEEKLRDSPLFQELLKRVESLGG